MWTRRSRSRRVSQRSLRAAATASERVRQSEMAETATVASECQATSPLLRSRAMMPPDIARISRAPDGSAFSASEKVPPAVQPCGAGPEVRASGMRTMGASGVTWRTPHPTAEASE